MIHRTTSELHFVRSLDPVPTVEVQMEGLENQELSLEEIVLNALAPFAKNNSKIRATIYSYGTLSVNFHEPSWSEFLIVAGSEKVLKAVGAAFSSCRGVQSRYSDYIPPGLGIPAFHIEDGLLWQPEDAVTWYSASQADNGGEAYSTAPVPEDGEVIDDINDDWEVAILNTNVGLTDDAKGKKSSTGRTPEQAARFRAARADAKVASIRQNIEQVFGLPPGSVALCGPDGRAIRGDAFIGTLRNRWSSV